MFVRVAVPIPSTNLYLFRSRTPRGVRGAGKRVLVPFGKKRLTGWIVETLSATPEQTVREIIDLPDPDPFFNEQDLDYFEWISRYYICPLGKVLGEILPGRTDGKIEKMISRSAGNVSDIKLTEKQKALIDFLRGKGEIPVAGLPVHLREASFLRRLEQKGLILLRKQPLMRRPVFTTAGAKNAIQPNEAQKKAFHGGTAVSPPSFSPPCCMA